jgi:hypothetical protein
MTGKLWAQPPPSDWAVSFGADAGVALTLQPSENGQVCIPAPRRRGRAPRRPPADGPAPRQVGCFAEQRDNWRFVRNSLAAAAARRPGAALRVLNGFAYTGGATLAARAAAPGAVEARARATAPPPPFPVLTRQVSSLPPY